VDRYIAYEQRSDRVRVKALSSTAIRVDGLGKKYRIRHQPDRYVTLRDVIAEKTRGIFRPRPAKSAHPAVEDFWALKDISFDVARGEVVGIIGRNGAGKSTLLKVISRITEPNEGRIALDGRVASMLEVGTGFHPELTGRENYLNGAILGMRRAEIARRFDEIVAFAGVETFLDTPVKRFSSGMYLRLAFAVAAHLETETLIVDEVLAVGDAEFQKKCLGKMSEVARGGRTVLFVSHNMSAIRRLTGRCILLDRGRLALDAPVQQAIDLYLTQAADGLGAGTFVRQEPPAERPFHVRRVTTQREPAGAPLARFDCDHEILVCIDYAARRKVPGLYGYMTLQRPRRHGRLRRRQHRLRPRSARPAGGRRRHASRRDPRACLGTRHLSDLPELRLRARCGGARGRHARHRRRVQSRRHRYPARQSPQRLPVAQAAVENGRAMPLTRTGDRNHGLDLLRGLAALGIATFHFLADVGVDIQSLGTFGVYVFFVLSGLTMMLVYADRFSANINRDDLIGFFWNRFTRIVPLLAAAALVSFVVASADIGWNRHLAARALQSLLTGTGLFALHLPGYLSTVTGAWSLGIELAFYVVFPIVCLMVARARLAHLAVAIVVMVTAQQILLAILQHWAH
jgi:ABC-type polysaccharide/polyol phosphate transport system ATPase subunit